MLPEWSTACPDWERRIVARESLITFPPLFPAEAEQALDVFGDLRLRDLAGCPCMRDVARPWISDFVAAIFGAYDAEAGRRLIRESFLLISKKNGKSTTAAGIMMTALIRNWRESGEFLILAPTLEIANNAFFPARDMVYSDETLSDLLHVAEFHRTITHRVTGATLKVIAADNESVGGKKAIAVLVDELWLFGKKPNAENMLLEATGGLASRPEGFVVYLSTQSDEPPAGVFDKKLQYARGVRDGRIEDPQFLPVLYEFPEAMVKEKKYLDPSCFYVTNPNIGASVDEEFIGRGLRQAEESGEAAVRGFAAKHLNVQLGAGSRSGAWCGGEFWSKCGREGVNLDTILSRCEVATVGVDGGGLDDLLGVTVIGREKDTRRWLWWSHAWAHEIVLERRKDIATRLLDFQKDGDLTIVAQPGRDVAEVAQIVLRLKNAQLLPEKLAVGVDAMGIGAIVDELTSEECGITQEQIVAIPQGYKLNGAIKTTERKLAGGDIAHGDSRLMTWVIGNAKVEIKGNAVIVTKYASGTAKIDPLMAGFNAVTLMALNPEASGEKFQLFVL